MNERVGPRRLVGGRYRLDRLLARGGMAEVWQGTDTAGGGDVAVKILHPHLADEAGFRARFRKEGIAAARLIHPNIVTVVDTCADDGVDAIVMEMVRGQTLRAFLDRRGRLDPVEVVLIGDEVGAALTCAHRAGLVHRDIKPANILLADDGRLLVTDFGIAKLLDDPDVTTTSTMLGTVKYLAPEQVEGRAVDARTDVYALGAVLYECLTGVAPFTGDTPTATALARLTQVPRPPSSRVPGIDAGLDATILRALARHPGDRFAAAADLRDALRRGPVPAEEDRTLVGPSPVPAAPNGDDTVVTATPPVPTPVTPPEVTTGRSDRPRGGRSRPASLVAALMVVAALVVAALLIATTALGRDLLSMPLSPHPAVEGGPHPHHRVPGIAFRAQE